MLRSLKPHTYTQIIVGSVKNCIWMRMLSVGKHFTWWEIQKKIYKKSETKLSYKTPFQDLSGNLFKINLLLDD